jgi:hypothetical protein
MDMKEDYWSASKAARSFGMAVNMATRSLNTAADLREMVYAHWLEKSAI